MPCRRRVIRRTTRADMHCGNTCFCLACKGKVEQGARCQTFTKGNPVNKSQLIDALAGRYEGNRKQAAHALESVIDTITREVARGEKVAITGFGSFEKRVRDARWVRNPRTGERIKAKKTAIPKFNAGAELKAVVSGAKKLPKLSLSSGTTAKKSAAGGTAKKATSKTTATKAPAKKSSTAGTAKKSTATKTTASKTTASKSTATKAPAKKSSTAGTAKKTAGGGTTKKTSAAKTTATKAPAKKTAGGGTTKKTSAANTTATSAPAKKTSTAKKAPAKKSTAKKTTAKKS